MIPFFHNRSFQGPSAWRQPKSKCMDLLYAEVRIFYDRDGQSQSCCDVLFCLFELIWFSSMLHFKSPTLSHCRGLGTMCGKQAAMVCVHGVLESPWWQWLHKNLCHAASYALCIKMATTAQQLHGVHMNTFTSRITITDHINVLCWSELTEDNNNQQQQRSQEWRTCTGKARACRHCEC